MKLKKVLFYSLLLNLYTKVAFAAPGDPWEACRSGISGAMDYNCWICSVWQWISALLIPVSTLVLIFAGYLWMTSAGDTNKIEKAKEYIYGVLSGLGLLLFSYFLIYNFLGINTLASCIWH